MIRLKSRFIEMFGTADLAAKLPGWKKISEVGEIVTGSTPKTNVPEYWDGNIKWITPAEIDESCRYLYDSERKISEVGLRSCSLRKNPAGTVVLTSRAPIGKVAILKEEMYCNQGFKNIVCGPDLNNVFLYELLKNNTEYLNSLGRGATFREISAKIVESIKIPVPPIDVQNQFATFVDQVDKSKLIAQKNMRDIVKSRFIEMFGDVYAGSGRWKKASFYDFVQFNPKKTEIPDGDYLVSFVPMECVGTDNSLCPERDRSKSEVVKGYTYFRDGDVVIAKITPCFENGKIAIARNLTNGIGFGTTEFHVARPIAGVSNSIWLLHLLKLDSLKRNANLSMTGSAGQKRIQTDYFKRLMIELPPIELQNQFAAFVDQVDKSKLKHRAIGNRGVTA